jgi:predicted DNA-binding mobile mystery protein A
MSVRRKTLTKRFQALQSLLIERPKEGWINEVRSLLCMRAEQLATRLDISQASVSNLEKAERNSSITVRKLSEVADALGCDLYYVFIPREDLNEVLKRRAYDVVAQSKKRVKTTMALEDQLESKDLELSEEDHVEVAQLIERRDRRLWDED